MKRLKKKTFHTVAIYSWMGPRNTSACAHIERHDMTTTSPDRAVEEFFSEVNASDFVRRPHHVVSGRSVLRLF